MTIKMTNCQYCGEEIMVSTTSTKTCKLFRSGCACDRDLDKAGAYLAQTLVYALAIAALGWTVIILCFVL